MPSPVSTSSPGPRTLIVMRHAKSDWSVPVEDRLRPLNRRGRRQAAEAGRWLAAHAGRIGLAVVSPAVRVADAWRLAAAELPAHPPERVDERAYTDDGEDLLAIVRGLGAAAAEAGVGRGGTVVLVSHSPACAELVELLTGEVIEMKTSGLAVVELEPDGPARGRLVTSRRPPTAPH